MLKPVQVPDETFFSTLNHNPHLGAPGAFLGEPGYRSSYWNIPRIKNWGDAPCESKKFVREICIWGVRDLPFLRTQAALFVNKLFWDFQPYALNCLNWRIHMHIRRDFGEEISYYEKPINLTVYKNHEAVKNHQ